jgi:hypothetical protein
MNRYILFNVKIERGYTPLMFLFDLKKNIMIHKITRSVENVEPNDVRSVFMEIGEAIGRSILKGRRVVQNVDIYISDFNAVMWLRSDKPSDNQIFEFLLEQNKLRNGVK